MSPPPDPDPTADWPLRWARLAESCGITPDEPLLLALSGGADSVFLTHLLARAEPTPPLLVVHVDHGLRGAESLADARFCAGLAAELALPFHAVRLELDPASPDLERVAREARYTALADQARRQGISLLVTGHHSDDALETLMIRWLRGTDLSGLAGLPRRTSIGAALGGRAGERPIEIVRPLLDLRRAEIRRQLTLAGLPWREDSSNRSAAPTRNRIRNLWLPEIARVCGPESMEGLRAFHSAVRRFEDQLARLTADLDWRPPLLAAAQRSRRSAHLGGCLERARLVGLPAPLLRRTLWRLIGEGCGHPPSRGLLETIQDDLRRGRCTRHALGGAWVLQLRSEWVHLSPPAELESAEMEPEGFGGAELALDVPGRVILRDGRAISAALRSNAPGGEVPRSAIEVELEAPAGPLRLTVRAPRPGDRFRGLGAPGSRPLGRFLADAGIPREERPRVPLVLLEEEILWVVGVRPCHSLRVRPETRSRLHLRLHDSAEPVRDPRSR